MNGILVMVMGWIAAFAVGGALWALVGAQRKIERLTERNAAQGMTIVGLMLRLERAGAGGEAPPSTDAGVQATQVPLGPEIASGGAVIRNRSDRVRKNLVAEDWARVPQPGDAFTVRADGVDYRGVWPETSEVAELEAFLASGLGPDAGDVNEKPDTDTSANKGA